MTEAPIYLDYAASTPVDARVWERMREVSEQTCANPSSTHAAGVLAQQIIARAAGQLADLLNADSRCLVWTSGATESDNLAITGGARYRAHKGRHLVTMKTEHKAVTDVF
jgi:cysteine desulfurase